MSGGQDFTPTLPNRNGGYWQGSVAHPEKIRAAYCCEDLSDVCTKKATPQACRRAYETNAEVNGRCWSEKFAATGETCILDARCEDTYEPVEIREYQRITRHLFDFAAIGLCPDGTLTDRSQCVCSITTPGSKPTCRGTGELL